MPEKLAMKKLETQDTQTAMDVPLAFGEGKKEGVDLGSTLLDSQLMGSKEGEGQDAADDEEWGAFGDDENKDTQQEAAGANDEDKNDSDNFGDFGDFGDQPDVKDEK